MVILAISIQGCNKNMEEESLVPVTWYIIFNRPLTTNTTLLVDNYDIINLNNYTFWKDPAVTEGKTINMTRGPHIVQINIHDYNKSYSRTIDVNNSCYIIVGIIDSNYNIRIRADEPYFQ